MSELSPEPGEAPSSVDLNAMPSSFNTATGTIAEAYAAVIGRMPLLSRGQVVGYAKDVEAGLFAERLLLLRDPEAGAAAAQNLATDLEHCYEAMRESRRKSTNRTPEKLSEIRDADARAAAVGRCVALAMASDPEELAAMAAEGRRAKKILVATNLRFVASLAQSEPRNKSITFMDNVGAGNQGLIRGLEEYDYKLGFTVTTAVAPWIRKAMKEQYQWEGRTVRLTREAVEQVAMLQEAREAYEREQGTSPTLSQLAGWLKMEESRVAEIVEWARRQPRSLDEPAGPGAAQTLQEVLADTQGQPGGEHDQARIDEVRYAIEHALGVLNERERHVILAYYFTRTDSGDPPRLSDIAAQMGITGGGASYLHVKALAKIRDDPELGPRLRRLLGK